MQLHLYGIVRADQPAPTLSSTDTALSEPRTIVWEDLAVIVSDVDDDHQLTEQDAVAHLDVLNQVVMSGPVLPLRFGTTALDEDAVRSEVLASAAPDLRRRLDALDGLVELRVDLTFDEDTVLRSVMAEDEDLRVLVRQGGGATDMDERIRLGEAVSEHVQRWQRERADALLEPLVALAERSTALEAPEPEQDRRAFLLRSDRLADMDDAVQRLQDVALITAVDYVGPLPAYSFLDNAQLTAAAEPQPESGSRWGW
jgi:hypothetical protein